MHDENAPQEPNLESQQGGASEGITFDHGGIKYTVSVDAALGSGLVGHSDRIQLPDGMIIMVHPHIHEDKANTPESIVDKGGKIWQIEE